MHYAVMTLYRLSDNLICINWCPAHARPCLHLKLYLPVQRCPVWGHWRCHSATTGSASCRSVTNHWRPAKWPHHANNVRHTSLAALLCLRTLSSKLHWWHMTVSMADHQRTSTTSVHRSSLFSFVPGFALRTMMTWLYHVLRPCVMVHTVSALWHPRFGTCCHFISRTLMLVATREQFKSGLKT